MHPGNSLSKPPPCPINRDQLTRIDGDDSRHDLRQSIVESLTPDFADMAEVLPAAFTLTEDQTKTKPLEDQAAQDQAASFLRANNGDILIWGRADQIDGRSVIQLNVSTLHTNYPDGSRYNLDEDHLIDTSTLVMQIYMLLTLESQARQQQDDPSYNAFIDKLRPFVDSVPPGAIGTPGADLDFVVGSALRNRWSIGKPISILEEALNAFQAEQALYASIKSDNQLFAISDEAEIMRWLAVLKPDSSMLDCAFQLIEQARSFVPIPDDGRSALLELRTADLLVARTLKIAPGTKEFVINPDYSDLNEALNHYELAKQLATNGHDLDIDIQNIEMSSIVSDADDGIHKIQKIEEELHRS